MTTNTALDIHRERELRTIQAMIKIYCAGHSGNRDGLCEDCSALMAYAEKRLERCPFGEAKPTCANCTVHCYRAEEREQIRQVMRYSGPRMLLRHPWLTVMHLLDGKIRKAKTIKQAKTETR